MSQHRGSETPLASEATTVCTVATEARASDDSATGSGGAALLGDAYPSALVLRLRVLQVVCGISGAVMGTVACIEERGHIHLGLAVPAGCATVIAAAASIHTSRGFSGYRPPASSPRMRCGAGAVAARVALPLAVLWCCACALHAALAVIAAAILVEGESSDTLTVLAAVELAITACTLSAVVAVLAVQCRHDPD